MRSMKTGILNNKEETGPAEGEGLEGVGVGGTSRSLLTFSVFSHCTFMIHYFSKSPPPLSLSFCNGTFQYLLHDIKV